MHAAFQTRHYFFFTCFLIKYVAYSRDVGSSLCILCLTAFLFVYIDRMPKSKELLSSSSGSESDSDVDTKVFTPGYLLLNNQM